MELAPGHAAFYEKFSRFSENVPFVSKKIKNQIGYNKARLKKLQKNFIQETEDY